MEFKNYKREKVDLIQHCFEQKAKHQNLTIFVGTDSISVGGFIHYFAVVAFRYGMSGAHFIFAKDKVPTYRFGNGKPDIMTKLRREGHMTLDIANLIVDNGVCDKDQIIVELDYNDLIQTISTKIIPEMKGWAMASGYQVLTKYGDSVLVDFGSGLQEINEQVAVKAANHLCQGVSG